MKKRLISLLLVMAILFTMMPQITSSASAAEDDKLEVIQSLNALLIGVGVSYYPEQQESNVALWTDEEICNAISGKLLWDDYKHSDSSYLNKMGLKYWNTEDWYLHFDFEQIQKVTQDTFGRDYPKNFRSDHIFVSGDELLIMEAIGESTTLAVQNYTKQGDTLTAVGTVVYHDNINGYFRGYFTATFKENPSSIYGYTLISIDEIEENQNFDNLSANASSELVETTMTHYAGNVLDHNLETSWVEGVDGVGKNEWIKLMTTDGSKMELFAIDFDLGYQKNEQLMQKNGWPYKLLIECEGDYQQEVEFFGYNDVIVLDQPVTTSWVKITILEASKGTEYDDTCISEIRFRGIDSSMYFAEYLEESPIHNEQTGSENRLVIYSDYNNLSISTGSTITLSAGILVDGEMVEDVSGITFQIEDTSILSVSTTDIKNNCRYVKLKGLKEGTTIVVFNDSNTGYISKVPVTVYDNHYHSYTLSSVPTQYIDKYPTNIYNVNGLFIDSYTYKVNDDQSATVSFDVYNTNYTYGVVEVCDENGNVKDAVLIEKMTSSNTSIKKAVWDNVGYLIRDIFDGDLLSYRQESGYSKRTPVSVKIPKNGYIKICTDPKKSLIVGLVNSADILMSMASLAGELKNFDVNSKEFSEKLTKKLVTEKIYAELVKDGSKMPEKLWKNVGKEVYITSESMGDFTNTIAKNISDLNLGDVIADTALDFGWDIGEDTFSYFSGPIGTALKFIFTIGKVENLIIQNNDLINSVGTDSICIQNQGGGFRSSQQITVESKTEFPPETALNVFTVTLDSTLLDILKDTNPELHEAISKGVTYTYNISLLQNGEEMQPDSAVTVYIPIPEELQLLAHAGKAKIYRIEEDGTMTEMDVEIEDGCFVFTTDHFSLYTLVGYDALTTTETQNENGDGIPTVAVIGIIAAVIVGTAVIIMAAKKRKK